MRSGAAPTASPARLCNMALAGRCEGRKLFDVFQPIYLCDLGTRFELSWCPETWQLPVAILGSADKGLLIPGHKLQSLEASPKLLREEMEL